VFLTKHVRGFVSGLDESPTMVAIARSRPPDGLAIGGNVLCDGSWFVAAKVTW